MAKSVKGGLLTLERVEVVQQDVLPGETYNVQIAVRNSAEFQLIDSDLCSATTLTGQPTNPCSPPGARNGFCVNIDVGLPQVDDMTIGPTCIPEGTGSDPLTTFTVEAQAPNSPGDYEVSANVITVPKELFTGDVTSNLNVVEPPNQQPSANITDVGRQNSTISPSAEISDPENEVSEILWTLTKNGSQVDSSVSPTPTLSLDGPGSYVLSLRVTDEDSAVARDSETFTVQDDENGNGDTNQRPEVNIINLNATTSQIDAQANASDPDGSIQSITWTLLRNNSQVATASGSSVTFMVNEPGQYEVVVTATDDGGKSDEASDFVTVPSQNNQPPQVSVSGQLQNGSFVTSVEASDPDGTITSFAWELLRDGQVVRTSNETEPTFPVTTPGNYTARLTVQDNDGSVASDEATFTIEEQDDGQPQPGQGLITPTNIAIGAVGLSGVAGLALLMGDDNNRQRRNNNASGR